jgi:hypothetical protein
MVTIEEALRNGVPVLAIDVKGDLPNLLLAFPSFDAAPIRPWAAAMATPNDGRREEEIVAALASGREKQLRAFAISEAELARFHGETSVRVTTPGSTAGEPLHVLSSLERRSGRPNRGRIITG